MKAYRIIILFSLLYALTGCEKEIKFRQSFEPKIVVNSLLNPDSLLTVDLWWSRNIDDNGAFRRVENASVAIAENGHILFESVSGNAPMKFDYKPLPEARYSISVKLDGYPEVTASTIVPAIPQGDCVFDKQVQVSGSVRSFNHYDLKSLTTDANTSGVYLTVRSFYDPKYYDLGGHIYSQSQFNIYTNNIYTDTFNRSLFPDDAIYTDSPYEYYRFVRIPEQNTGEAFPMHFSVFGSGKIKIFNPHDPNNSWVVYSTHDVTVTAASPEYDGYYKYVFIYMDTTTSLNPFIFEIYPIPSNIKNGLGIFAGYSQKVFSFDFNIIEV